MTLLVVEDDLEISDSMKAVLSHEGYTVEIASNGQEGLEHLRALKARGDDCLVLLDLMMPVMSGGEMLAAIRADASVSATPVIIVSAWPSEAAKLQDMAQGFVKKPFALEGLLTAVQEVLA